MIEAVKFAAGRWKQSDDTVGRLLHGRGGAFDGFQDINLERIGNDLLVVAHRPPAPEWIRGLDSAWSEQMPGWQGRILIQHRYSPDKALTCLNGEPVEEEQRIVCEAGLQYQVELGRNQNWGFFADMAFGREWLRRNSQDRRVLNLFAYTCSFGVAALAGGAREVVNVDMSAGALRRGQRNHSLNDQAPGTARFLKLDILRNWPRLRRAGVFDLVVVDPPSNQARSFRAQDHYPQVAKQVARLVAPGGNALFCLNMPFVTEDEMQDWIDHCGWWEFERRLENPPALVEPDPRKGLKVMVYRRREERAWRPDDRDCP